jgi:dipeptidase D
MWRYFAQMTAIPRPSGEEAEVREFLSDKARGNGWEVRQDAAGNVVFAVPGKGSLADAAPLILQGHLDMVCEKNSGVEHDFLRDPIPAYVDGDWIRSKGTTLGADNGIAVAIAMAVAEADLPDRVPLELLFTVDEEEGLTGASELDSDIVKGTRLLNIDSEEDGVIIVGCAGGVDMNVCFAREPAEERAAETIRVSVAGLRGGHSGVNIHEGRGNAIHIAARMLDIIRDRTPGILDVYHFEGGNKKNAIPRECRFTVGGAEIGLVQTIAAEVASANRNNEPGIAVTVEKGDGESAHRLPDGLINFVVTVPAGVIDMDGNYPDLVYTSSSIGVAVDRDDSVELIIHGRSLDDTAREMLEHAVLEAAVRFGGSFEASGEYPGWTPNPDSQILNAGVEIYEAVTGSAPAVLSIHAGLECGVIGARIGSSELLSIGPTIENAHSPDEQLNIASAESIYAVVKAFAQRR